MFSIVLIGFGIVASVGINGNVHLYNSKGVVKWRVRKSVHAAKKC